MSYSCAALLGAGVSALSMLLVSLGMPCGQCVLASGVSGCTGLGPFGSSSVAFVKCGLT